MHHVDADNGWRERERERERERQGEREYVYVYVCVCVCEREREREREGEGRGIVCERVSEGVCVRERAEDCLRGWMCAACDMHACVPHVHVRINVAHIQPLSH